MRTFDAGGFRPLGPSRLLRSFAVTGGRTRPLDDDLELESLVAISALGQRELPALSLERRQIAELCQQVLSVAEVSAHLDLPLGVTRVLVGDMADEGLVRVHRPVTTATGPDPDLLERVLDGLRAI
jgi:hypothetical protein